MGVVGAYGRTDTGRGELTARGSGRAGWAAQLPGFSRMVGICSRPRRFKMGNPQRFRRWRPPCARLASYSPLSCSRPPGSPPRGPEEPKDFAAPQVPPRRAVRRRAGQPGVRRAGRPAHLLRRHRLRRRLEVTDGGLTWKPIFDDQPTSQHRQRSRSRRPTRTSSTSAPARRTSAATSRRATASSRATDAGKTWKHVWKQVGQIGTMAVHPKNAGHRLRRRARPRLRPERRARRLPHHRRRQDVAAACCSRTTTPAARDVCHRPEQPADRLRRLLADAPPAVGDDQRRARVATCTSPATAATPGRHWRTRPQGDGRSEAERPAATAPGARSASPSRRRTRSASTRSSRRRRAACSAPTTAARRGSCVNDDRSIRQRAWYYSTLTVHPTNPDVVYAPQVPLLQEHRRRQDVQQRPRAAPRRPPRPVDRPEEPEPDDRRQRRRRGHHHRRRQDVVRPAAADHAVLPRLAPTTARRTASWACMQDLGTASGPSHSLQVRRHRPRRLAPASAAARPGYAVADPSDPNIVYAGEYGGIMTRYDHRTGQARNITRQPVQPVAASTRRR